MKTAFVTGAATGIGEALVVKLQKEGWQVFAGYRSSPPEKARWFGISHVTPVKCDVSDLEEVQSVAEQIAAASDAGLDLLINNAAYAGNSGVVESPVMEDFRKTFEVNFYGPINTIQSLMPLLKQAKGKIINTTSASVYLTIPMGASYPVSKLALKALTDHLRLEMAPFGVQVTSLAPGGVETPMTELGEDVSEAQWSSIPDHLRDQYRRHFSDGASVVSGNFKLFPADVFADKVYRKVIRPKRVKPSYLIGPGVAALPWLHRLLPTQQVLDIWARMFAAKA